ncbi:hypothetical protein DN396_25680 [Bacillus sp. BF9-10]|nr:hypothetical protein DN396_25680 [Bacillus sp. BF9-10]
MSKLLYLCSMYKKITTQNENVFLIFSTSFHFIQLWFLKKMSGGLNLLIVCSMLIFKILT